MYYFKVVWPYSQKLMDLEEDELSKLGIEVGDDCSYFVQKESMAKLKEKGYWPFDLD